MPSVKITTGYEMVNLFDSFLFDADGVLWLGDRCLPGAVDFLHFLVQKGKNVFIVTNNSTKTLDDYAAKCQKIGFDMIPKDHIVSPAIVLAHMLSKENSDLPVYIVGSPALKELLDKGVESFGIGPDPIENYTSSLFIHEIDVSRAVQAVIVSYDIHINYAKIMKASNYLQKEEVKFFATNEDATFPGPNPDVKIPGSGMNVAAIEYVAGKKPIIIGKPAKPIFEYIKERFNVEQKRTLMVGDRCDTDIKFGKDNDMKTLLVGTGIHTLKNVTSFELQGRTDLVPDFYSPSLNDLYRSLS